MRFHANLPAHITAAACAAGALLLGATTPALANDTAIGGTGTTLIPLTEERIQMLSEDIRLELRPKAERWKVHARYRFKNHTDQAIELQVGFPEHQCNPDEGDCYGDGKFKRLRTTVRGKVVKHRVGKVAKDTEWAPVLGRVFVFDVRFKPNEELEIVHTYEYDRTVSAGAVEQVQYLTRTGANWFQSIGRARFTVVLPWRPWGVEHNQQLQLVSYVERLRSGRAQTELVFEATDWTPAEDFWMAAYSLMHDAPQFLEACPHVSDLTRARKAERERSLAALSLEELRLCRNAIYAHHGRTFKDEALNRRFYPEPEPGERITFRQNPHFTEKLLRPPERRYVAAIRREELRRQKRGSGDTGN